MEITKLFHFIEYQKENNPREKSFTTKYNGEWKSLSTEEFYDKVQQVSRSLLEIGIKQGDKVAIISTNNCTEWSVVDLAVLQIGAITVPMYPTITAKEYEYIFNHSEAKICIFSDDEIYTKIKTIRENVGLEEIYSFDHIEGCKNLEELQKGDANIKLQDQVNERKEEIDPYQLATIIYTSGTTGVPKGVMLSHNNIVSNVIGSSEAFPLSNVKRVLSFLPACHIYERTMLYFYQYAGMEIYYAESIEKIGENLVETKPNFMTAVPRLLEKVYDKIYAKGEELTGIKKSLFFWAINLGLKYKPFKQNGSLYEFKLGIARKLIFSKWKDALGGNLSLIASGSAPLQKRIGTIFTAAGITIAEGYGLTETSPVVSLSEEANGNLKLGTVGKPIKGSEVKIAEDGEILVKGPNVMMGYYKDPELTASVIVDGFFHTGDIGVIDSEGFLKITDRKKQIFKTSGGKYIAPQVLESQYKKSPLIEQIMVIGEGQKMPAALIQPAFDYISLWLTNQGITDVTSNEAICKHPKVIEEIDKVISEVNQDFGKWEQVKKFELTSEVWSIEGGELTPTMKVRRKPILEKYKSQYNKIYEL